MSCWADLLLRFIPIISKWINYKKLHRGELISALLVLFVDQKNDQKLQLFLKLVDKYFALFVLCFRPVPHRWSEVAVVGGEVGDGQGEDEEVRGGQLPHRLLLIRKHHHHRGLRIRSVQPQPQPSSIFAHTHTPIFRLFHTWGRGWRKHRSTLQCRTFSAYNFLFRLS